MAHRSYLLHRLRAHMRGLSRVAGMLILFLCGVSCSSPTGSEWVSRQLLNGSWQLYETGNSPGSGYYITEIAAEPPQIMTFSADGRFSSNIEGYTEFTTFDFEVDDDFQRVVLTMRSGRGESVSPVRFFDGEIVDGNLRLYPGCDEGCHLAFQRLSSRVRGPSRH